MRHSYGCLVQGCALAGRIWDSVGCHLRTDCQRKCIAATTIRAFRLRFITIGLESPRQSACRWVDHWTHEAGLFWNMRNDALASAFEYVGISSMGAVSCVWCRRYVMPDCQNQNSLAAIRICASIAIVMAQRQFSTTGLWRDYDAIRVLVTRLWRDSNSDDAIAEENPASERF